MKRETINANVTIGEKGKVYYQETSSSVCEFKNVAEYIIWLINNKNITSDEDFHEINREFKRQKLEDFLIECLKGDEEVSITLENDKRVYCLDRWYSENPTYACHYQEKDETGNWTDQKKQGSERTDDEEFNEHTDAEYVDYLIRLISRENDEGREYEITCCGQGEKIVYSSELSSFIKKEKVGARKQ